MSEPGRLRANTSRVVGAPAALAAGVPRCQPTRPNPECRMVAKFLQEGTDGRPNGPPQRPFLQKYSRPDGVNGFESLGWVVSDLQEVRNPANRDAEGPGTGLPLAGGAGLGPPLRVVS